MDGGRMLRRAVKGAAAGLVHFTGLRKAMNAVRRFQAGGTRILIVSYHRVVEDFTGEVQRSIPGLLISRETFRKHLEEARRAGYQLVSLGEALDVMAGRKRASKDLCVITFDDGYRDVYRNAYPVLKELGIPAITYLPAGLIGTDARMNHDRIFHLVSLLRQEKIRPMYQALPATAPVLLEPVFQGTKSLSASLDDFIAEYPTQALYELVEALERQLPVSQKPMPEQGDLMTWEDVRQMASDGFEFGAHTLHHRVLTLEPSAVVYRELQDSKARIEHEIGRPVQDFAYCNGWYSDEVVRALVESGYRSAVTTEDTLNRIGGDPFALKRKVLWENFSIGMLGEYSSSLTACQLDDVFGMFGLNHPVPGRRGRLLPPTPSQNQVELS